MLQYAAKPPAALNSAAAVAEGADDSTTVPGSIPSPSAKTMWAVTKTEKREAKTEAGTTRRVGHAHFASRAGRPVVLGMHISPAGRLLPTLLGTHISPAKRGLHIVLGMHISPPWRRYHGGHVQFASQPRTTHRGQRSHFASRAGITHPVAHIHFASRAGEGWGLAPPVCRMKAENAVVLYFRPQQSRTLMHIMPEVTGLNRFQIERYA